MKTNSVRQLVICSMLLFIVSCKKSIDKPFTEQEEFTSSAFSSNQSKFSQARERPFKGRIVGNIADTLTTNPAIYIGSAYAKGIATHIGAFSKVTNDSITFVSTTTMVVKGTFIMTNLFGEQIAGKYEGTSTLGSIPGTFSWFLNATITGGSGRFAHATGTFVFLANGNYIIGDDGILLSGDYKETFDGTIIY
jgi:hypothetical protein